jgi:hypothetical protein
MSNITAVGYRVDLLNTSGIDNTQRMIRIESFDVVAAIPEPTTVALLAGSLLGLGLLRRHRSKAVR